MRAAGLSIIGATAMLAACSADAPVPHPSPSETLTASPAELDGPEINVLAFGNSLFAGYGLASRDQSYPAQLQAALRQGGRNVRIVNAGVSGDTTAAGRQRLAFTLDSQEVEPDLALLELGGNDLLRGLPPAETRANLDAMFAEFAKRGIPVVLMSLQAPPNSGPQFQRAFDAIYPELAKKHKATLVPFVTAQVFADPKLIQADRVHPTAQGVSRLVTATKNAVAGALPPADRAGG